MSDLADLMTCVLAREVRDGDVVGVGLGTPLALCACLVARRSHAPGAEVLVAGAASPDADLVACLRGPAALAGRTVGFVPHLDTMDMAERQAMTLQFLRPAQVDGSASLNTSRAVGPEGSIVRFPGGLATADVPALLPRLVVYHPEHSQRALPAAVAFATGRGGGVERAGYRALGPVRLVTSRGVIGFGESGPRLESVHPGEHPDAVRGATGFELDVPDTVAATDPPTPDELAALEAVDPHRLREIELPDTRAEASRRLASLVHGERSPHA